MSNQSAKLGGNRRCECDGYCPDTLGLRWDRATSQAVNSVSFSSLCEPTSEEQFRVNLSVSPHRNGVHKEHALDLPAIIGMNQSVMANSLKERTARGVHPDE